MRGDGRIYQRGAVWWIEYWHNGKQVRESSQGVVYKADGTKSDGTVRQAAEKLLRSAGGRAGRRTSSAPRRSA